MNKNTKIKVRNRSLGSVGYTIPDMGSYPRRFMADETKEISFEELQKLSYIEGGAYLLQNYLVIEDIEARTEILGNVEFEYDYTEADIKNLLMNGSYEALLDCLDFAPKGVVDLVKKIAVNIELNDIKKCNAIHKVTGFNVSKAIEVNQVTNEDVKENKPAERRVATAEVQTEEAPARRVVMKK